MGRDPLKLTPGQVFGSITVLHRLDYQCIKPRGWFWLCRCVCGKEWPVLSGQIPRRKSCGCLGRAYHAARLRVHGLTHTGIYKSYYAARERCINPSHKNYHYYGGRGIRFLFTEVKQLFDEIGQRPVGMTLDRKDPDGHYEPGNVRWATRKEQEANKKR